MSVFLKLFIIALLSFLSYLPVTMAIAKTPDPIPYIYPDRYDDTVTCYVRCWDTWEAEGY